MSDNVLIFCNECDFEKELTKSQFLFNTEPLIDKCPKCKSKFQYELDKNWYPLPDGIHTRKQFKEEYLQLQNKRNGERIK